MYPKRQFLGGKGGADMSTPTFRVRVLYIPHCLSHYFERMDVVEGYGRYAYHNFYARFTVPHTFCRIYRMSNLMNGVLQISNIVLTRFNE